MGRIVVGVDGSEGSRAALRWAVDEAKVRDAAVEVVMSWNYPPVGSFAVGVGVTSAAEMERDTHSIVVDVLAAEGLAESDRLRIEIGWGPPALVLLGRAEGADLLVVGSRGHGAFSGMVLGSVSLHVATHATVPTVIVPIGRRPE